MCMQILSERGVESERVGEAGSGEGSEPERTDHYSNMAEVLVQTGCHELLFQILEKFEGDQGE